MNLKLQRLLYRLQDAAGDDKGNPGDGGGDGKPEADDRRGAHAGSNRTAQYWTGFP